MNMSEPRQTKEPSGSYSTTPLDLGQPLIVQRDGQPVGALISIEEYERYRAWLRQPHELTASEARRAADRAVFHDLVGCALSSGDPVWKPAPEPRWCVPYRSFDGQLLITIEVNAQTGQVLLTDEERATLLAQVEQSVTGRNAAP